MNNLSDEEEKMKPNKIMRGSVPPLFNRIVDDASNIGIESKLLSEKELQESIIYELSILLNTRCTLRKGIYESHIETIPFFGFPDFFGLGGFSYFNGSNTQTWLKISRFVETAIQMAEPRLQNIHVKVESYDPITQTLSVAVTADIVHVTLFKSIHFSLQLKNGVLAPHKAAA
ncbi:MAG: type VI secretion system baseplate subunit TssE [Alphaproteobacteria bacterium]|nr:type VI secretion system baseplate subunit TssE [Alphaproteobacteria bacterium]